MKQNSKESWRTAMLILKESFRNRPLHSFGYTNSNNPEPIGIASYGNFSFVQAPPKSKKTFYLSLVATAYLCGETSYTQNMIGYRENRKLIHYDTEQSRYHAHRFLDEL